MTKYEEWLQWREEFFKLNLKISMMKAEFPEDHGKYNEYDFDNRISYDEDSDSMYIYVAPPQGQVGTVLVYEDGVSLVTVDTDEVNTQVGIEIVGVSRLMKKFALNKIKNN